MSLTEVKGSISGGGEVDVSIYDKTNQKVTKKQTKDYLGYFVTLC